MHKTGRYSEFHLGWQKRTGGGVDLQMRHELAEDEFNELVAASGLLQVGETSATFAALVENWRALGGLIEALSQLNPRAERHEFAPDPYRRAERLLCDLTNYLSSVRMWVDSTKFGLSRRWGKNSTHYQEFTGDLARAFDERPGYRFTWHLRNAYQHIGGLPLSISVGDGPGGPEGTASVAVTADAQTLLGSYPWHAKVKRDLEQGPSTVDVMALLKDGFDGIVLIEHRRSERHFATCKPALRVISRALDRLEMPRGATPMLFASAPPEGDEWDLSPVALPDTETVEALNEAIDRGDAVRYLITNARQGHRALTPVAGTHPTEVRSDYPSQPTIAHGHTKAIVGAWFDGGPSAAMLAISRAIDSGPTTATATLVGMLNLVGQKLNEVDLLMGPTVAQQVAFIAEPDGPTSKGSSSPAGDPRH